jgi:hypothetical protein
MSFFDPGNTRAPRATRPSHPVAWLNGHPPTPEALSALGLAHLLEINHFPTQVPSSPLAAVGVGSAHPAATPGPPPMVIMLAAQSKRFACDACNCAVDSAVSSRGLRGLDGLHSECVHSIICSDSRVGVWSLRRVLFSEMLNRRVPPPEVVPFVRYIPAKRCIFYVAAALEKTGAMTGASVLVEALLDHAEATPAKIGTLWRDPSKAHGPLRCALYTGASASVVNVLLRRGLFDPSLTVMHLLDYAAKQDCPVTDDVLQLLHEYLPLFGPEPPSEQEPPSEKMSLVTPPELRPPHSAVPGTPAGAALGQVEPNVRPSGGKRPQPAGTASNRRRTPHVAAAEQELDAISQQLRHIPRLVRAASRAVASLPVTTFTGEDTCFFCHAQPAPADAQHEDVVVLPCGHAFHRHCVTPWLQEKGTCPTCRGPFFTPP